MLLDVLISGLLMLRYAMIIFLMRDLLEHEKRQLCYQLPCNKLHKEIVLSLIDEIRNELNESFRRVSASLFQQKGCRKNSL